MVIIMAIEKAHGRMLQLSCLHYVSDRARWNT